MKVESLAELVWYGDTRGARLLRSLLHPASLLFAAIARMRVKLYEAGVIASGYSPVPVVSVGNISVGGTGKTPFVIWLARKLSDEGVKVAVVSRGYGSAAEEPVVLDPGRPSVEASALAGDEALLVGARSACPVVTYADRLAACVLAADRFSLDLIIADDAFQHLRLRRDLDIVLLGGSEEGMLTLPAGPLRERPEALARAQVALSSKELNPTLKRHVEGAKLACRMKKKAVGLVGLPHRDCICLPLEDLRDTRVVAVAAIARPEGFVAMLEEAGAQVVQSLFFRDHHRYDEADWEAIEKAGRQADLVVTTEKDLVKLLRYGPKPGFLRALRIDVEVEEESALLALVDTVRRRARPPGGAKGLAESALV